MTYVDMETQAYSFDAFITSVIKPKLIYLNDIHRLEMGMECFLFSLSLLKREICFTSGSVRSHLMRPNSTLTSGLEETRSASLRSSVEPNLSNTVKMKNYMLMR